MKKGYDKRFGLVASGLALGEGIGPEIGWRTSWGLDNALLPSPRWLDISIRKVSGQTQSTRDVRRLSLQVAYADGRRPSPPSQWVIGIGGGLRLDAAEDVSSGDTNPALVFYFRADVLYAFVTGNGGIQLSLESSTEDLELSRSPGYVSNEDVAVLIGVWWLF